MQDMTLQETAKAALEASPKRVQRVIWQDTSYWLKRVEKPGLRMRLQKGDPKAAFQREVEALKFLNSAGVPVPQIVLQDDEFFVMSDGGRTVQSWVASPNTPQDQRMEVLVAAARALAALHAKDICHGRPAIRDLAYRDGQITFFDFENFTPNGSQRLKVRDLLVFAHSLYRWSDAERPEIDAALAAYRELQPQVWQSACDWCAHNRWIDWLTKPLQNRAKGSKDFRPIPYMFRRFR